ncbi:MAG: hypothetical protein V7731_08530 [Amphritea sp.]
MSPGDELSMTVSSPQILKQLLAEFDVILQESNSQLCELEHEPRGPG